MGNSELTARCDCKTSCTPGCSPAEILDDKVPDVTKVALGATGVTVAVCAACCSSSGLARDRAGPDGIGNRDAGTLATFVDRNQLGFRSGRLGRGVE